MKKRNQNFLLGLATILFVGLFLVTFFFLYTRDDRKTRPMTIHFVHSQGVAPLKKGSPISLAGALGVGEVTAVRAQEMDIATPQGPRRELIIVVDAQIDEQLVLYEDVQITTDQPAVGGGASVVIVDVGTPGKLLDFNKPVMGAPPQSLAAAISTLSRRLLSEGGVVDLVERMVDDAEEGSLAFKISASLTHLNDITDDLKIQLTSREGRTLIAKIHVVLDDLNSMTGNLREQMDRADGTLLAKVHVLLDRLDAGLVELDGMLAENRPVVKSALSNVEAVTRTLAADMLPALQREFVRDDDAALLGKLHASMDRLNVSLENVVALSDSARRMVLLNRPAVDRTIENIKDASEQMRVGVQELFLSPWRVFQPPAPGERERVDAFTAARRFAEAAAYLNDASLRLEAVVESLPQGAPVAADEDIRQIRDMLKTAFDRYRQAEEFLWQQMKP